MSKYTNYSNANFITIATTQDTMLYNARSLSTLLNSNANGLIILPLADGNRFTINDSDDSWALDYINSMILDLIDESPNLKIWIGTPRIENGSQNKIVTGTGTSSTYKRFTNYADYFLSKSYCNNIYGFLYNQEMIYNVVNSTTPTINNEVKLMNDFAYYIRNTKGRDLIWIPYYGKDTSAMTANQFAERVAIVVNRTTCFDCAFIQSMYIRTDVNATEADKNFAAIVKSVTNNNDLLYKRDLSSTFITAANKIGNCNLGVEYEYSYDQRNSKFPKYTQNYNSLNCPKLFYWQGIVKGSNTNSQVREMVNTMVNTINTIY